MSELWARMSLSTYRIAGSVIYPFMGPFLAIRARRGKEDRSRRYERYGYPSADKPAGPLVWFHAASVGESMAVLPLITRVDGLGINTIMTTGTVTSAQVVKDRLPPGTFHQYVPLDLKPAVKRFINHWKPDLAVFTESEIWPMTVLELAAKRIPQVLVNARMSDRSFERWRSAPKLAEALFGNFAHVAAQSQVDAGRFKALGARPISISGNLKVDTDALPCDEEELAQLKITIARRPTWIAVSTHFGEEEIVARVHKKLSATMPGILTVLVPRHPERGDEIATLLKQGGLKVAQRSLNQPLEPDTDIYLGDTIGEMGLFLRLGSVAFIGRSMYSKGGQNPLEPAQTGTAILSGQHVDNFREAYANLIKSGGARLVRDEDNLTENIEYLLKNHDQRGKMIKAARQTVAEMGGALERTLETLDAYVFPLTVKRDLEGLG
ncbi:MAG: lipid IV(A) 3-deoxy-D-manno-octulosonic acid transferase [Rhizobiaceae bacterium]|nr:lipid IV(A) 3-deoxy-D-manno-octulosonic acid transferase [Rhizobiaceae bacterium]